MSRFWSKVVHDLTPYVPGEQPKLANLVKLNTNESPYPPSPKVLAAIQAELADGATRLRLYPDPNADLLKSAIARHHGVAANQIFVGNGSDEVLAHIFMALLKHPAPILFPDITYSFYPVYCGLYDVAYRTVPPGRGFLDQSFRLLRTGQRRHHFPQSECTDRPPAGARRHRTDSASQPGIGGGSG
jgi:histidinol-phosphate aminotransferase